VPFRTAADPVKVKSHEEGRMARAKQPHPPLVDLVRSLWRPVVLALPFAAFFLLVSGQSWRAFPDYWLAASAFSFATHLGVWATHHFVEPRLLARLGGGPRVSVVMGGVYVVVCLIAAAIAAIILNFTLIPGFLGSARAVVLLAVYTLLFGVLFVGIALASNFYRTAIERAGSDRELQLARRIQRSFLLSEFPRRPRLDVHAVNVSSREVSGDFYDVVPTGDDTVLVAIADVSGKGVPAALLSSMLQASLRTQAGARASPATMMATINTLACHRDTTGQFATFFLASIDEPSMVMRFTNAGHNFPVWLRAGRPRVLLETGGLVVGMMDGTRYEEGAVTLEPGDRIVFYTDGVTEADDGTGEMFGEDRLYTLLDALPADLGAERIVECVLAGVRGFLGETEPGDDITVMAVRVAPSSTAAGG
jgi:hypothetical protein